MDTFQQKIYRSILQIKPTHLDRTHTNKKVLEKVTGIITDEEKNKNKPKSKKIIQRNIERQIKPYSQIYYTAKQTLLENLADTDNNDPTRQITFKRDTIAPLPLPFKRVGRPRSDWLGDTLQHTWDTYITEKRLPTTAGKWDQNSAAKQNSLLKAMRLAARERKILKGHQSESSVSDDEDTHKWIHDTDAEYMGYIHDTLGWDPPPSIKIPLIYSRTAHITQRL